ncbi:peroxisomal membrane protein PEX16-like [Dendronephthya gigantea]|uniref:peroxisomal membrane protein PEX16-like n=1 Tax=Dendronephthya gigantea TaxID=151771 RepID=UPI001069BDB2|nr:peroxisomal membrane protein PEX16-like [Dendronephthya gigantea]
MAEHASFRNLLRNAPENAKKFLQMQFQKVWNMYSSMLLDDPAISTRLEALFRVSSYVIPGRFVASKELGELLYGLSNLLALLHDYIFRCNLKLPSYPGAEDEKRLLRYLSVIESVEVFLEMAAQRLWGEIGKWLIVVVIQFSKVAFRLLLLCRNRPKLQKYPLIPLLNRQLVFQAKKNKDIQERNEAQSSKQDEENMNDMDEEHVWKGKRSGRFVRSLSSTPPNGFRSWKLPEFPTTTENPTILDKKQFYAELLYVIRPLLHLPSMFVFGEQSWKPWLFSLIADITSLSLHTQSNPRLTALEKTEISRRLVIMLFYLLRSPFYDRHTKGKILMVLNGLANNVPFVSVIIRPLLEYLPTWQRTYFYNWCS